MTSLPEFQKAVKIGASSKTAVAENVRLPVLNGDDVLVRVAAVSINHVDGKSADMSPSPGATSGTDFSGIVVALGSEVNLTGSDNGNEYRESKGLKLLQIGDRVMGGIFGNNPLRLDNGAFAEYVAVPASLIWHVPAGMDLTTASTLPAAMATVGLSLFQYLQIPLPPVRNDATATETPPRAVLVYGGGTATGAMAIQILHAAGIQSITTCSPASAPLALRHGAAATFDYNSPTCGAEIREFTSNNLSLALDCITDTGSMAVCYEALGDAGGRYVALDSFPLRGHTRRSVVPDWVCTYSQFGHAIVWAAPYNFDARPDHLACARDWYVVAQRWLDQGLIEPHPQEERRGGLAAVGRGMEEVMKGMIKGRKLVYPILEDDALLLNGLSSASVKAA
ncbi:zinc-binding dehydrogenase domain-containing protein [Sarocladium implicatum]|nr:zinc-binding dehydrogenase domain-containing protein [Sarocladium implicatum]